MSGVEAPELSAVAAPASASAAPAAFGPEVKFATEAIFSGGVAEATRLGINAFLRFCSGSCFVALNEICPVTLNKLLYNVATWRPSSLQ
jgi:hypothetical protein